ncbi:hypothetical protein BDD12DRAFT_821947 [Trichophaea hybrida]|nr:hypothetical protein BDD12DRAFT_821947 [Trichophaea hybrida]
MTSTPSPPPSPSPTKRKSHSLSELEPPQCEPTPKRARSSTEMSLRIHLTPSTSISIDPHTKPLTPIYVDPTKLKRHFTTLSRCRKSPKWRSMSMFELYNFKFPELQAALKVKGLEVSFSEVTYSQIAPLNLWTSLQMRDAERFPVNRAGLSTNVFKSAVNDMNIVLNQYSPPIDHQTEEARSRFLAPMFNRVVAHFRLLLICWSGLLSSSSRGLG